MKVLIDNGHGENTPGKRSPDGRLMEWAYSREIADMVVVGLRKLGIDAERIVKEDTDVPLSERCRRANVIYKETGKKAILISIHCNAAGSGASWMKAKGWSVFVSNNASGNSKKLADCLSQAASVGIQIARQCSQRTSFRTIRKMWSSYYLHGGRMRLHGYTSRELPNTWNYESLDLYNHVPDVGNMVVILQDFSQY